jgi:Terminase large subunit, T4likevirus-type, N-terminal
MRDLQPLQPSAPPWARSAETRILSGQPTLLDLLWANPGLVMERAGLTPDPWQTRLLRSSAPRTLLLASRQSGKSSASAGLALLTALLRPPALVLLLSPTLRQSGELFRAKVLPLWRALGCPLMRSRPTQLELELANGSRIVSLPESESGIRGFSGVSLLVIDEASRVSDGLYAAVRPMLATSKGRLIALSTPFGQRGWFFEAWGDNSRWDRIKITADQCQRISPEFLAEEKKAIGDRWWVQEYFCEFTESIGAVFSSRDIQRAMDNDVKPLFEE